MEFFNDIKVQPPEDLHAFYEDGYEKTNDDADYDYDEFLQSQMPFSFDEILEYCLIPTVESGFGHVGKVLIWCAIFRVITQTCKHLFSSF